MSNLPFSVAGTVEISFNYMTDLEMVKIRLKLSSKLKWFQRLLP